MLNAINRDTQLCMSLSARPGNFGTRFQNFLYEELGLNFVYKAFTTQDLPGAIRGIRALGIRGCAVSMPFKETCIEFLDELDPSAQAIQSVNTIVNTGGHLRAYNTDYTAIRLLLESHQISPRSTFILRGSGGMAKAVTCALRNAGFDSGLIIARNQNTGQALANSYDYEWRAEVGAARADFLINVTPVGMSGGPDADALAFSSEVIATAAAIMDVVALPSETPFVRLAREKNKTVISGAEIIALQALEQFVLYTGVRPSDDQFKRASAWAQSNTLTK